MGRRPTKPGSIARLRERKKKSGHIYYYYDTGGKDRKEIALGSDYGLAIMEYAKLERDRTAVDLVTKVVTFRYVAEKYMVDVVHDKAENSMRPAKSSAQPRKAKTWCALKFKWAPVLAF